MGGCLDVRSKTQVHRCVDDVKESWGSVDILVNNAGGALHTPHVLEEIREEDWNLVVDVNLKGAFFCCQAVIPEMVKHPRENPYIFYEEYYEEGDEDEEEGEDAE